MVNHSPKVSIIVPVYNREKTIGPCVESILNSEFTDFEVLLIDDGSTDATRRACEGLASVDHRIKLFRKPNEGVSAARNVGLTNARGEWVTFADSDDAVTPSHLNVMALEHDEAIDLVMTGHTDGRFVGNKLVTNVSPCSSQEVVAAPNAAAYLFNDFKPFENHVFPIWNKFFKRSILSEHSICFDTTLSLGEDQVFLCDYLQHARGIIHFKNKSYVNVSWPNLSHLGQKLRTPSDYLHNQRKNYAALCNVVKAGGQTEQYAVNYGIDRPITRILYNYTKIGNRHLVPGADLLRFTKQEIIPFLRTIDVTRCRAVNPNVRIIYGMLMKGHPKLAITYCRAYNLALQFYGLGRRIVWKIKRILFR